MKKPENLIIVLSFIEVEEIFSVIFYLKLEGFSTLYLMSMWTPHFDLLDAFPTRWRARFLFNLKNDFYSWFEKWLGVATYFCFIFKRVNKIRKKNPMWLLIWKRWSTKNRIGFGGQVTYREGTVWTVAPL